MLDALAYNVDKQRRNGPTCSLLVACSITDSVSIVRELPTTILPLAVTSSHGPVFLQLDDAHHFVDHLPTSADGEPYLLLAFGVGEAVGLWRI